MAMLRTARVLVADDDELIRSALAELIMARDEMELVATAVDADSAIEMAARLRPDVVLLDYRMPGGGGVRAAEEIRRLSPETAILCLSAYGDPATASKMLSAGATAFLVKGTSTVEEIADSILSASGKGPDGRTTSE